jgi:hypothetical protein
MFDDDGNYYYEEPIEIDSLIGQVPVNITVQKNDSEIIFEFASGKKVKMYHEQDCCEDVSLEDIEGDFKDLLNTPIVAAEERSNQGDNDEGVEEWTFYYLASNRGSVNLRWYGTSNGYYSTAVNLVTII